MAKEIDLLQKFGERVRKLRKAQGYSQEDFAYEIGISRSYMSGVERGKRNIALKNIERIAKALGCPISTLFRGL